MFVWLGMHYLVHRVMGGQLAGVMPIQAAILEHVLFGTSIGLGFLPFQRVRPPAPDPGPTPVAR
jgi:hypothetical protein